MHFTGKKKKILILSSYFLYSSRIASIYVEIYDNKIYNIIYLAVLLLRWKPSIGWVRP